MGGAAPRAAARARWGAVVAAAVLAGVAAPAGADAPAAATGDERAWVVPGSALWEGQQFEVRGEGFRPFDAVDVWECPPGVDPPEACDPVGRGEVDAEGRLAAAGQVRRRLAATGGTVDCAVRACRLVLGWDAVLELPLRLDPNGRDLSRDLPAQPECVPWPTRGWPVGELPPGVDAAELRSIGELVAAMGGNASLAVVHGGRLVFEAYADGVGPDTVLPSFSVSKSFAATVLGLLVDDGRIGLDDPAPVREWSAPGDPRGAITVRHLLNMASGLAWDEDYFDAGSDVIRLLGAPDAAHFAADRPLATTPGTTWQYSTGDTVLLARVIGEVAGVSGHAYEAFLHERLFDPLGIAPVEPGFDAAGTWQAGWRTDTTARGYAKLGLLYLRGGVWEGRQFLSREWVDVVRTPSPAHEGYGGQFWLNPDGSFEMIGFGGQRVAIVPALDLVVVGTDGVPTYSVVEAFRGAAPAGCGEPPAVAADAAAVEALGSTVIDVLADDRGGDVGFAPETLTVATPPRGGTAVVEAGAIRYTAARGFAGTDRFTYVVCSADRRWCPEATVEVEVAPVDFAFLDLPADAPLVVRAGGPVALPVRIDRGPEAVDAVRGIAVDCATGRWQGAPGVVRARLVAGTEDHRLVWNPGPDLTGCVALAVTLVDGRTHTAVLDLRPAG